MIDVIKEFNRDEEHFAKETVIYCQNNKKAISDILLKELDRFIKEIKNYDEDYCEASVIYSIYLLAEFRDKRLFNRVIKIINLCCLNSDGCLWDAIIDNISNIIISVFDGDYQKLDKIIRNPKINVFVRNQCLKAYAYFFENGEISREEFIKYLEDLIAYYNYEEDELYTWIADIIANNKIFELLPKVRELYEKALIDLQVFGKYDGYVDCIFDYSHLEKSHIIKNTIDEMSWWACFKGNDKKHDDLANKLLDSFVKKNMQMIDKKVGRNEPCPCGSGKKYKHCCALKKRLPYQNYIDESINEYPKRKTNDNEKDIYDFYSEDIIELDKLMYKFLCHKAIPIYIQRNYKLEEEKNIEICEEIMKLLKSKLDNEHYETIDEYDNKNSIHYSLHYFFIKYTEILTNDLENNGYKHNLGYVEKLEEIINLFYDNFNLNNDNEHLFIDRIVCLYRYKDKIDELIELLEGKLVTCTPNVKYYVYCYLFDVIMEYYKDSKRINEYIKKEKDRKLIEKLKKVVSKFGN